MSNWKALPIGAAIRKLAQTRAPQLSPNTIACWNAVSHTVEKTIGKIHLGDITTSDLELYQARRLAAGAKPRSVNTEVSVIRLTLKRADRWRRIEGRFQPVRDHRRVSQLAQQTPSLNPAVQRALERTVDLLVAEIKRRTPVRTGALQASVYGEAHDPFGVVATDILYGAPVGFGHVAGKKNPRWVEGAHMFERALIENLDQIVAIFADQIERIMLEELPPGNHRPAVNPRLPFNPTPSPLTSVLSPFA